MENKMKDKLEQLLSGNHENHILPFFWQHGEDDETLLCELHKIYESGIRAVCAESRPAEEFGQDGWFEDMRLILDECKTLGMEFWLLDDKHCPTGYAAGELEKKHPELGKHAITERHTDVVGPKKDAAVLIDGWLGDSDKLIGVVACERVGDGKEQKMTGRAIDLTAKAEDGIVFFDVPEGYWRVFTLIDTPHGDGYVDPLREDSVDVLIDAVYESHYRHLGGFFGTTFRGFFSDEPFIMQNALLPLDGKSRSNGIFPWNDNVRNGVADALGNDWMTKLPSLWFASETAAETRIAYMDTVTNLYRKCFSCRLGDWCRAHGVEYIGHIVEDDGRHSGIANAAGHFFRSLDGQDMAGIDVVLCQIVPGMSENTIAVPCSYDVADHEFFHFGLAKLGSSHAHIQKEKHGRAMCEIYGAYGWAEGLPMMKWLSDHMLVRGINEFVPHAFSPKYPDDDCPPHFYAGGHNPEFRGFRILMDYMNRVSTVLTGGRHQASAGILYHAQAEWSGGKYMKFEKAAKVLTQNQIDFDVIPEDYLAKAEVRRGRFCLAEEEYPILIVPYAEILPDSIMSDIHRLRDGGVQVRFIDALPSATVSGKTVDGFDVISLDQLADLMAVYRDIAAVGENTHDLRFYHSVMEDGDVYFFTNEGINGDVKAELTLSAFSGGRYMIYDPMENRAFRAESSGKIELTLTPYQSVVLIFGDAADIDVPEAVVTVTEPHEISVPNWRISFASPEEYDPAEPENQNGFGEEQRITELYSIVRKDPRFAGFVRYTADLALAEGRYIIDLGEVGETASLFVNGCPAGERIIPPYRFEFDAEEGKTTLTIITTSHLGYKMRDAFSQFLTLDPVGLLGPVKLRRRASDRCNRNPSPVSAMAKMV